MPRFARLKKDWMLRGWSDVPLALTNWSSGNQRELKRRSFYVAGCCDGLTDFDSLAFLPEHHALLDRLIEEGIAEACREGDSIEAWQRYRKAGNPRLTGIHWCVTGRCNLNCRHCYMEAPAGKYGELPFGEMARLIDQFEEANVVEVSLTGGEPFLRADLMEILGLLARRRIRIGEICSNGLLITDGHLEAVRGMGFSPVFQISFDGVGGHDSMRGTPGAEPRATGAIRRLRAAGFAVAVATSIDRLNIDRLPDTYELMKRLDIQSWSVAPPQRMGNWKAASTATSPDEEAEACAPLLGRWIRDGRPFNIQLAAFFKGRRPRAGAPGREAAAETAEAPGFTPDSYDCAACREQPNLLPDGTLLPCPGYLGSPLQRRMPNLLRKDLSSVWRRSFLRKVAGLRKRDLLEKNPECAACELFKDCGAGCRASALRETGNLMAKDPVFCDLWRKGFKRRFRELARRLEEARRAPSNP